MSNPLRVRGIALAIALASASLAVGTSAQAGGNIFLTGHDTDFHMAFGSSSASTAMTADLAFVRNGSSLPVLTFDSGSELTGDLTSLGISFTNVDPNNAAAITDALFNPLTYSAIIVASDTTCGGCDNTAAGVANIASHISAIGSFLNAGGGILGFAAADDPNGYAYVPTAASNGGGFPPSDGFVETPAGTAQGLVAENGDATHNYFSTPGTDGLSPLFVVAEVNGDNVESVFIKGASITCTGSDCSLAPGTTPLPASLPLLASGVGGLGMLRWRRKRKAAAAAA